MSRRKDSDALTVGSEERRQRFSDVRLIVDNVDELIRQFHLDLLVRRCLGELRSATGISSHRVTNWSVLGVCGILFAGADYTGVVSLRDVSTPAVSLHKYGIDIERWYHGDETLPEQLRTIPANSQINLCLNTPTDVSIPSLLRIEHRQCRQTLAKVSGLSSELWVQINITPRQEKSACPRTWICCLRYNCGNALLRQRPVMNLPRCARPGLRASTTRKM